MSGLMALKHKTASLQKCDLPECKNVSRTLYRVTIGGMIYKFCSGMHGQIANERFQKRTQMGITGPVEQNIDRVEEPEGGVNLDGFE